MISFAVIAFAIFVGIAIYADRQVAETRQKYLMWSCIVIALLIGLRDPNQWGDAAGYQQSFLHYTNDLTNFSFNDHIFGYSEFGFYFLGVLVKTFTDSYTIYFFFISAITFYFLYKSFDMQCIYPLLGLCIYMGRFMVGRNNMQIRAGLAIAIIIYATVVLKEKKPWRYMLWLFLAYQIHHSALVALPLYFVRNMKFNKTVIVVGIAVAFGVEWLFGGFINDWMSTNEFVLSMARSYVEEGSEKAWRNTLANPMIYYQIFILFVYTFNEESLSKLTPYYYIYRNAYFYSTILLIVLCQFAIVAARTSTIFATFEAMMVPMFILAFHKNNRKIPLFVIAIVYIIFFYLNWNPFEVTNLNMEDTILF